MKKLLWVLCLVLGLCVGTTSVSYAAQIPVVCLTEQEQFEYYKDSDEATKVNHLALTQFAGMAQGDTRTQTIRLHNNSAYQANFYITSDTIHALQTQNLTSDGAYQFHLQVGKSLPTAESLLFESRDNDKKHGVKEKEYEYITTLEAGCDTYLYLTFKLDQRGDENSSKEDYMSVLESIPIAFRAYAHNADAVYMESSQLYSVDSAELMMQENSSQTDDNYKYGVYGVLLLGGVGLVGSAVAAKNRKKGK